MALKCVLMDWKSVNFPHCTHEIKRMTQTHTKMKAVLTFGEISLSFHFPFLNKLLNGQVTE